MTTPVKPTERPRPQRVDTHHHIYPAHFTKRNIQRIVDDAPTYPASVYLDWSVDHTLEVMETHGIGTVIASMTSPGLWFGDVSEAREGAREFNELAAKLMRNYPTRFGAFAPIPLPDPEGSFTEIAHALDTLKLSGIGLMSSYDGKLLGDPAFAAVFDELNRRHATVFVHPTANANGRVDNPWLIAPILEFPFDTTRTIVSLVASGTLARCPNINFIFPHVGGTIFLLMRRVEGFLLHHFSPAQKESWLPNGLPGALKKLNFDVVSATNTTAMAAVRTVMPTDRLLFGTDHPFVPARNTVEQIQQLGFTEAELRGIERTNALALCMNADRLHP